MSRLALLALLVTSLSALDAEPPFQPGPVEPIVLRAVEVSFAGLGSSEPGRTPVADIAGDQGLHVLLHQTPARGERLLPSPDGRFLALVNGQVYDLQNQTLVFRNQALGEPQFWDGNRVVFSNGVVDAAQSGWARVRAAAPKGMQQTADFWPGQQGRGRSRYYRVEAPAGQSLVIRGWFPAPGYDVCIMDLRSGPNSQGWRYVAAAVDPTTLTVLAAYVGPQPNERGGQDRRNLSKVLHTLVRDPACAALCPIDRATACGGFREAVGASMERAYWSADLLPDGRIQYVRQRHVPGATLSCRWSDDAQSMITLQADRFTRWSNDWSRIGWIDTLSYGSHRPLAIQGTRLCLRIEGRAVWCDLATLTCSDARSPSDWFRPRVARNGAVPALVASADEQRLIPLHPDRPAGKVASGMLPGERGAWCRDGRNLHVLAGVQATLRSFDLGDAGPARLVSPPDGTAIAVVFSSRIIKVDLVAGTTTTAAIDQPLASVGLRPADDHLALAHPARRWPEADLHLGKELVRLDLERGTSRRWSLSTLCGLGPVQPGNVTIDLAGTLSDGRVVIACDRFSAKTSSKWTVAVDPEGVLPTVRSEACGSLANLDEPLPGLVTGDATGGMVVWQLAGNHAMRIKADASGACVIAEDGLVAMPRNLSQVATVVFDGRRAPISAFDLLLNRPDIILERIGLAPATTIALLREAWRRRIVRLGYDPAKLQLPASAGEMPAVRILDRPVGLTTTRDRIDLRFTIDGANDRAVRVCARIGGVTVAETTVAAGKDGRTGELRGLQLGRGINRIELAPLSTGGLGIPDRLVLRRDGPPGRTVVAALGVSRYREPGRDLQFAAADARDLAAALGGRSLVLTDAEVARERLPEVRRHLGQAGIDDLAVIVVAGHGLLDRSMQYRIATHDTDFADPAGRGIVLDELLDALRASPARRRLVLIDTCHAGEVEPAEMQASVARLGAVAGAAARGLRPARTAAARPPQPTPEPPGPTPGQAARILFQDAGRDDGITILAACRGDEASWESPVWGHGAFTAALLEGFSGRKADADGDGAIDLAELGAWAAVRVPQLTSDQQHPEVRAGDLDREVIVVPATR